MLADNENIADDRGTRIMGGRAGVVKKFVMNADLSAGRGKDDNIWKHLDNMNFLALKSCVRIIQASWMLYLVPEEIFSVKPLEKTTDDFKEIIRPDDIFKEVKTIISLLFPHFDFTVVTNTYHDILKLFNGEFFGYQKCDTNYHNLRHTQDCLLEVARLIHGAVLNGRSFSEKDVNLGIISAIVHDAGYIKTSNETGGTGGKFTMVHIDRSITFMTKYLSQREFTSDDINFCRNCLKCTGLNVKINKIKFISVENELMGKILGTADLLGQMSDPVYLMKLPLLFSEFHEAGIKLYVDEFDLIEKTPAFWEFTQKRFAHELGGVDRYLQDHFRVRWGIDRNLDREAIEKNIDFLNYILKHHRNDYRRFLQHHEKIEASGNNPASSPH